MHAIGEDFLHNFLGLIGIPIEMYPAFPDKADVILLTEGAAFDPNLLGESEAAPPGRFDGGDDLGVWRVLQGKGVEDLDEIRYTDERVAVKSFIGGFGAGAGVDIGTSTSRIVIPHLRFLTNDAWPVVRGIANDNGFPILLMKMSTGKGRLFVLTIPDNSRNCICYRRRR